MVTKGVCLGCSVISAALSPAGWALCVLVVAGIVTDMVEAGQL